MKRMIILFLAVIMMVLLCGCMSMEERKLAKENVKAARPIIKEYIKEHYDGGKIRDVECLRVMNYSLWANYSASDYVKASVSRHNKTYSVVVNVSTGECWDSYNSAEIQEQLKTHFRQVLGIKSEQSLNLSLFCLDIDDFSFNREEGISKADVDMCVKYGMSAEDVLKGNYGMDISVRFIDNLAEFESCDLSGFWSAVNDSTSLTLINFVNSSRYTDTAGPAGEEDIRFRCSDYYRGYYNWYNENTFTEDSSHFDRTVYNEVEYVWDRGLVSPDFCDAEIIENPQLDVYKDYSFHAVSAAMTDISISSETGEDSYSLYCFIPQKYKGKYFISLNDMAEGPIKNDACEITGVYSPDREYFATYLQVYDGFKLKTGIYELQEQD